MTAVILDCLSFYRLHNATLKAQEKLKKSAEERFEKVRDINEKKIELRCGETQRRIEVGEIDLIQFM